MPHPQLHTQGLLDLREVPEFDRHCRFDPFPPPSWVTLHYSANILPDFWGRRAFLKFLRTKCDHCLVDIMSALVVRSFLTFMTGDNRFSKKVFVKYWRKPGKLDNGAVLSFGQKPLACGCSFQQNHSTLESIVPLMIVYVLFGFKRQLSCSIALYLCT